MPESTSFLEAPWREGNDFTLLDEPEAFFGRMLACIEAAREQVLLEMYLVTSGQVAARFVAALAAAARRGVRVRALFDHFGSLGLAQADRRELLEAGVELRFYNPIRWRQILRRHNLLRNHRKLLVTDADTAFVGGAGLTDEFGCSRREGCPWRDLMIEIKGPVVDDWQRAFASSWSRSGGEFEPAAPRAQTSAGALGRVVLSDARHRSALASGVLERLGGARARAWIMSAYFVPSRRFRKALRRAARAGVDVRLLLPGPKTDHPWVRYAARRYYGKMLRSGIRIYEYQPRMLHGKMIICDEWVSVGSSNLDRWSFRWNLEANQEIEDRRFAAVAAAVFERDCGDSQLLCPRTWRKRAAVERVCEHIAGAIDRWIDRWRRPRLPF